MQELPLEITQHLIEWRNGNESVIDKIIPTIYQELSFIARRYLRRENKDISLQTTELINEAYLRLVDQRESDWQNRAHFFAVAARVMRNLLIDRARKRKNAKHGGAFQDISIERLQLGFPNKNIDLIRLDDALKLLEEFDERKLRIVELKFFAGLTSAETAQIIGVSEITVKREWLKAKAFLYSELSSEFQLMVFEN
jgi:RNA polymerase sigma factor (TIGR02999 family)